MDYNAFFRLAAEGAPQGAYLFHGEEEYIKQSALNTICAHIDEAARDMNILSMASPAFFAVRDACETMPFFADKRLVVAYEMEAAEAKQLFPYVLSMPETATLILYMRGAAHRDVRKLFADADRDVEFKPMAEPDAVRFLEKRARARGVALDRATAVQLVGMAGVQAHKLENEFIKAADYVGEGGVITADTLHACVTPELEYNTFRIIDQLVTGQKEEALRTLRLSLNGDSSSAIGMAHFLARQLKSMLTARLLLDQGVREGDIAAKMGVKSYTARAAIRGAKRLGATELRAALDAFASAEYMQLSGQMPAERAIELAIARYFL